MRAAALLPLALPAVLGACDLSMTRQSRQNPQEAATLWPGGPQRRLAPPGTIAEGDLANAAALATAPPLDAALLDRGQQRYDIFCAVCHGARGEGDGTVVRRGFPRPPSYRIPRLAAASPTYIVDVITEGHGVMYSYADRVPPRDRWAIAAYVKALQRTPAR